MRRYDFEASKNPLDVCSIKENGRHFLNVSSLRRLDKKFEQEVVKLFERPVSRGCGMVKSLFGAFGSVLTARFHRSVGVLALDSRSTSIGDINSGGTGAGRWSMFNDDPFHTRSSCARMAGSACVVANAVPTSEVHSKTTSNEKTAPGGEGTRDVFWGNNELETGRQV